MNIYLVNGHVNRTEYGGEDQSFDEIRLVKANNPREAELKYEAYWEAQTDLYSVYYHARGNVLETIE